MARNDDGPGVAVKLGAVAGLGYLCYYLITNLRIGGAGLGGDGKKDGSEGVPRDAAPLELRIREGTNGATELVLGGAVVTLEAAIARVRAGGRTDLVVITAGTARQGDVDATLKAIADAGIQVFARETPVKVGATRSGRGVYR